MERHIGTVAEMAGFATELVAALSGAGESAATILALSGDLGAGKTTLAQAIARQLGVEETVNSPTFVIQKVYLLSGQKWRRLVHVDAYRLASGDELRRLGWDELAADPGNFIVIEWPERVPDAIPSRARRFAIAVRDGDERLITYG